MDLFATSGVLYDLRVNSIKIIRFVIYKIFGIDGKLTKKLTD